MKANTLLVLLLLTACESTSIQAESLKEEPYDITAETFIRDGYSFSRSWINQFDSEMDTWEKGEWGFPTNLCEFTPSHVKLENGICELTISDKGDDTGKYPEYPYFGGEYLTTKREMYGRFLCRMKPNSPSGVVTSFFLAYYDFNEDYSELNENCEIDIEFCGTTDQVQFAVHYVDSNGVLQHPAAPVVDLPYDVSNDFHLWEIEWLPDRISFYIDGKLLHRYTDPEILAEMEFPMETHMNYWISSAPGWVGPFDSASLPISTYYDYVAFYKWNEK